MTVSAPYAIGDLDLAGVVVVPGWRLPGGAGVRPEILEVLRRAQDEGAFVLTEAGLLDGRRATTHWRYLGELGRRHPGIDIVADALYVD
jgi:transcriptional regulator GlxA family with amidase domain